MGGKKGVHVKNAPGHMNKNVPIHKCPLVCDAETWRLKLLWGGWLEGRKKEGV
jgi:hypothetical protein